MKHRIISYFSITKKEWNGTVVLVIAVVLVLAAPYIYQRTSKDNPADFKEFDKAVSVLNNAHQGASPQGNGKLGKGVASSNVYRSNKLKPGETLELNTADSAALTRIHGIGPSFARRIAAYRKKLGGFISKEQLKEVYGVDEEKYADIHNEVWVDASLISKISVNSVDFEQLRRFPYLSYKQANAVIQYRTQHGNYRSVDDMRGIAILNEDILRKITPYITFK